MDTTATSLSMDNHIPVQVFALKDPREHPARRDGRADRHDCEGGTLIWQISRNSSAKWKKRSTFSHPTSPLCARAAPTRRCSTASRWSTTASRRPINQVGTVSSPDPRTLVIQPWDGSLLKAIEKAIQTSDLGINPQNDGRVIRLVFPQLTEERRKDLTKQVRKYAEDAKVAVRNIRRDAVDYVKKAQKKGELTEDDQKKAEKDIQDLTDKHVKKIDEMCAKKEKELMEI